MSGKKLRVASNDLYGNVDDRVVLVYACFEHSKYMNNYVVFSFDGSDTLCYGSVHLKEKSLVIFSVRENVKKYVLDFLDEYMSDSLKSFEILDISNIDKVELVSYNEVDYDKLDLLNDKSIPKAIISDEGKNDGSSIFLYLVLFVLIMMAVGIILLYLKPELFTVKYKELECVNNLYDNDINLNYGIVKDIRFDKDDKVRDINVIRTYIFTDSNSYYDFKNDVDRNQIFTNGEEYKYIDDELKFKLFYSEESVIDDYLEMLTYLNNEGYDCIEREYEE